MTQQDHESTRFGAIAPPPDLRPLPPQPAGVPWPTHRWSESEPADGVDRASLAECLEYAFARPEEIGRTHALLVVHRGRLVVERYDEEHDATSTLPSWSMAKSILHALIGVLVGRGLLHPSQRSGLPAWQGEGDPRRELTIDQLLRMSSGLRFVELYEEGGGSDTIEMLFGSGKADVAGHAAALPLDHPPESVWNYSSGTSNILAEVTHRVLDKWGDDYLAFMKEALFDPLGMRSCKPLFDERGTWIASSFNFATARDFARFGLLYLRDGVYGDRRILPEGWGDYARTPTPPSAGEYGAHFWLAQNGTGLFSANGFRSQYIVIDPSRDLVLVRLGDSETDQKGALLRSLERLIGLFPFA